MLQCWQKIAPDIIVALLLVLATHGNVTAETSSVTATTCALSAGRDAQNNTITCNFGLTPEQLREVTKAAVEGATAPSTASIVALSQRLGISESATKTLLKIIGEEREVPDERLAEVLTKVANDYIRLKTQVAGLNPDNPNAKALIASAKFEIEAGHFDQARELLRQSTHVQIAAAEAAQKLRDQAQAAADAQMLGAARSTAAEGDVALTERHYLEASKLYAQAAAYVPSGHPDEHNAFIEQQASALLAQGDERGDDDALLRSAAIFQAVLQSFTREREPLQWAGMQMNLGNAFFVLGERENGTHRLEQAVEAYTAALKEQTRERGALQWAKTKNNLGTALQTIGERESSTHRLKQAIEIFNDVLEAFTREHEPLRWAKTQMNIGTALATLGTLENDTSRLEQAVEAYTAALKEQTRERERFDWAMTQMNLGNALQELGAQTNNTHLIEQAVEAYTAALQIFTRERAPFRWGVTQINLGNVLFKLGKRESGTGRLKQAVEAYTTALQVQTRRGAPLYWAMTQLNLGNVLQELGRRENSTIQLARAVEFYEASLKILSKMWTPKETKNAYANIKKLKSELISRKKHYKNLH